MRVDSKFTLSEVPGFDKKQVKLDFEQGMLIVTAESEQTKKTECNADESYVHRERFELANMI